MPSLNPHLFYAIFLLSILIPSLIIDLPPAHLSPPKGYYLASFRDPLLSNPPRWFQVFTFLEVGFQLPATSYLLVKFYSALKSKRQDLGGRVELLSLIWALEAALTTAVCVYDVPSWEGFSDSEKNMFMYGLYGPYMVMPSLMAVDMYRRILRRFDSLGREKEKAQ